MPTKAPVPVRPAVLAWARRSACVTIEAAAKATNVPVERLEEWERGDCAPSLPQLRKLAEKYHRPLAVMLLPEPPREFQALKDFRRIDPKTGALSPMPARVAYEIRLAQDRRDIALEIIEDVGGEVQPFKLSATIDDDPETVAVSVRQFLRVSPTEIAQWARKGAVFDGWRSTELLDFLKPCDGFFVPTDELVLGEVSAVLAEHPRLVMERKRSFAADPFVIATARVLGGVVVTEEGRGSTGKPKIPDVCETYRIECINLLDLIRRVGWRF